MAIMALPTSNTENTNFPSNFTNSGFVFQGQFWKPILDTNKVEFTISKNSSFPSLDIFNGKLFFFDEYNIGKRVMTKNSYPITSYNWAEVPTAEPKPELSINYYGNSQKKRPIDGFSFIHPSRDFSIGKEVDKYPTFSSIYMEKGYGAISYQEYQQYCTNKSNNWLHPIMEKIPSLVQNKQMPKGLDVSYASEPSWRVMWRAYDIGAGLATCVIFSLIYVGQCNSSYEYYDYIYPYEQLLGLYIPEFALDYSEIPLVV